MTATFRAPLTVDILGAAPAAPVATKVKLYMKADGLYALDSAATEVKIGPSAGAADASRIFDLDNNTFIETDTVGDGSADSIEMHVAGTRVAHLRTAGIDFTGISAVLGTYIDLRAGASARIGAGAYARLIGGFNSAGPGGIASVTAGVSSA
ncbi:MAG: hypothetical protein ACR2RB_05025, partial [Gammaproteobacteria bacterium]